MLLLVANVVLGASHDASSLDTLDGFVHSNTRKDRVGRETLPVAAALWRPANWANDGTKLNVDTLVSMLGPHLVAALVDQTAIP